MNQYLIGLITIVAVLVGAEQYGEHRVQVKWDIETAKREVIAHEAKVRDEKARAEIESKHKKEIEYAKSQAGKSAIADWLRKHGMLPNGTSMHGSSGTPQSPQGSNDTSCKCGTSGSIESFASGCAQDAITVELWQEWSIREGLEAE